MISRTRTVAASLALGLAAVATPVPAAIHTRATVGGPLLPIGQTITPTAAPGATFQALPTGLRPDHTADANGAVTTALSPDGRTLLILTTGYNANFSTTSGQSIQIPFLDPTTGQPSTTLTNTFQWVFVYDVSAETPGTAPKPTYDGGIFKGAPVGSALGGAPGLLLGA